MTQTGLRLLGSPNSTSNGQRPRVLFVSHEATRTGAPKIILNILKHFHQKCDIQCETILHNGGPLLEEFQAYSDTPVDCLNSPRKSSESLQRKITRIVARERNNPPILAVCNSMESRFISEILSNQNLPIVSLIHELPSSYSEADYQNIYDISDRIVFPVQAVRDAADSTISIPSGKGIVLPQGLLQSDFGKNITTEVARAQIREELSVPSNSFLVLGCGTLDLRKGIDHFAAIARRVVHANRSKNPIHFIWVGEGPRWTHSPFHYVKLDLEKSGANAHVHFLGEREDVEPYFVGSDVFLMASRVDPFPCVIHEAMATGLPVVTFANSGGAQEAVAGGAGIIVPYADYEQASGIIRMLSMQPEVAAGIRERSAQRVLTRYQFEDYGDKLIDVCEALINRRIRSEVRIYQHRAAA